MVNGPGEAKADIGVAGGNGVGIIFKKGEALQEGKRGRTACGLSPGVATDRRRSDIIRIHNDSVHRLV